MGLVFITVKEGTLWFLWLYEQARLITFITKVNPATLHIPCMKAIFVNGSVAAELSHFRVGAAELGSEWGWGGC